MAPLIGESNGLNIIARDSGLPNYLFLPRPNDFRLSLSSAVAFFRAARTGSCFDRPCCCRFLAGSESPSAHGRSPVFFLAGKNFLAGRPVAALYGQLDS